MIAQALLESAYGTSGLSSAPNYNLFGVKGSYGGQVVYMATQEYIDGQWVTMNEPFRKYSSYWESSKITRMFYVRLVFQLAIIIILAYGKAIRLVSMMRLPI